MNEQQGKNAKTKQRQHQHTYNIHIQRRKQLYRVCVFLHLLQFYIYCTECLPRKHDTRHGVCQCVSVSIYIRFEGVVFILTKIRIEHGKKSNNK